VNGRHPPPSERFGPPVIREIQDEYRVKYHRYWYNEETGEVFCLCEAPSPEAAEAVHREAHGLVADEIVEVKEGS
jgi:hypothetical protein